MGGYLNIGQPVKQDSTKNSDATNHVAVIILNWNAAEDTIGCLASVRQLHGIRPIIVLVDNDSDDGSMVAIENYLQSGKDKVVLLSVQEGQEFICPDKADVYVIHNNFNAGYGGGNNLGIDFAVAKLGVDYVWIVNNDARFDKNSLLRLLDVADADDRLGFVGSVVLYSNRDDVIQCFGGGKVYPLLGKNRLFLKGKSTACLQEFRYQLPDYLMGVSLLVKADTVRDVGLMDDAYFMYSEEVDWQYRARDRGWEIAVSDGSYVYHSDSGSLRGSRWRFQYYRNRAAIMFIKRFYGLTTATIAAVNLGFITIVQNFDLWRDVFYGIKGTWQGLLWDGKRKMPPI